MMLRIMGRKFCAGMVRGGAHAPILRNLKGKTPASIRDYCKRRGWILEAYADGGARICAYSNCNDADRPCLFPGEGKTGCARDARLRNT